MAAAKIEGSVVDAGSRLVAPCRKPEIFQNRSLNMRLARGETRDIEHVRKRAGVVAGVAHEPANRNLRRLGKLHDIEYVPHVGAAERYELRGRQPRHQKQRLPVESRDAVLSVQPLDISMRVAVLRAKAYVVKRNPRRVDPHVERKFVELRAVVDGVAALRPAVAPYELGAAPLALDEKVRLREAAGPLKGLENPRPPRRHKVRYRHRTDGAVDVYFIAHVSQILNKPSGDFPALGRLNFELGSVYHTGR